MAYRILRKRNSPTKENIPLSDDHDDDYHHNKDVDNEKEIVYDSSITTIPTTNCNNKKYV